MTRIVACGCSAWATTRPWPRCRGILSTRVTYQRRSAKKIFNPTYRECTRPARSLMADQAYRIRST
jgi:peptide methionine sulfoxide reductase MsrA